MARQRRTAFGSASERELFTTLQSHWGDRYDLYPSLPLASIIDFSGDFLTPKEQDFLFKTSVDYTLCTKAGGPLVSVDFDGLGHGFSRDGQYVEIHPTLSDPYRKLKFDLKLSLCESAKYPYFVVSYDEKAPLGESLTLTIVDGVIGQVLASQNFEATADRVIEQRREHWEQLDESAQYAYLVDLMAVAEMEAEAEWNPIARAAAELEREALNRGLFGHKWRMRYHEEPPPKEEDTFDPAVMERRLAEVKSVRKIGCTITHYMPAGDISASAWVRNISGSGVHAEGLSLFIARILLFKKLLEAS